MIFSTPHPFFHPVPSESYQSLQLSTAIRAAPNDSSSILFTGTLPTAFLFPTTTSCNLDLWEIQQQNAFSPTSFPTPKSHVSILDLLQAIHTATNHKFIIQPHPTHRLTLTTHHPNISHSLLCFAFFKVRVGTIGDATSAAYGLVRCYVSCLELQCRGALMPKPTRNAPHALALGSEL